MRLRGITAAAVGAAAIGLGVGVAFAMSDSPGPSLGPTDQTVVTTTTVEAPATDTTVAADPQVPSTPAVTLAPGFENYRPGDELPTPPAPPADAAPGTPVPTVMGPYGPIYPDGYSCPNGDTSSPDCGYHTTPTAPNAPKPCPGPGGVALPRDPDGNCPDPRETPAS